MKINIKPVIALLAVLLIPLTSSFALDDAEFAKAFEKYLASEAGQKKIGASVKTYFTQEQNRARADQAKAREKKMEDQFNNPLKVDIGNSPTKGPKNAKVTVVEFSDFECPYCKRGADTVEQILKEYPKDVKVVFKNLPLSFHKNAKPAAIAALAAGKQGKYWEMHDELFKKQRGLTADYFLASAKTIGLNVDQFKKDLADESLAKQVADDEAGARKLGITGTPGFVVNGVLLEGAQPLPAFKKVIDRWLAKK